MYRQSWGVLPLIFLWGLATGWVIERQDTIVTADGTVNSNSPFTASESLVPTITLTGSLVPTPTTSVTATLLVTSQSHIPTLTLGQSDILTRNATSSKSHGLGIPDEPQPTFTFTASSVAWTSAVAPTATLGPPPLPPSGFRNVTGEIGGNVTISGNSTTGETLSKRIPAVVDWRNRWGYNWITSIQNQGGCGSCWAFSATALMECMVRIQHGAWSKRSEADVHDSMGIDCETGNWPENALSWAHNNGNGIADEQCDPYRDGDRLYFPCADRSGRTLRVPTYQPLVNIADQKKWLNEVGPITGIFEVYYDFDLWTPSKGVYKYDGTSYHRGKHAILIVGYDDNQGCWIIKNSWGSGSGDDGFWLVGYEQVSIDSYTKFGLTNVDPDPWDRKRHQNGLMLQSGFGANHKNFELVRASPYGGFTHIWRQDEAPFTWYQGETVVRKDNNGNNVPNQWVIGQPIILSSSFNRDFEVIYLANNNVLRHWYYSQNANSWFDVATYGSYIGGYPGYVQTDDSNFALVVRRTDGSLVEYQRDVVTAACTFAATIGTGIMQSGPALVQSNVGLDYHDRSSKGNLYVVAVRDDGRMQMFWRAGSGANTTWVPAEVFGDNIPDTPPVMVQDFWRTTDETTPGGFQLCVAKDGQVQHWQRVNTDIEKNPPQAGGAGKWDLVYAFGENIKHVWSLMHGAFNHQLELVAEDSQGRLWHWSYQYPGTWVRQSLIPGP